MLAHSCIEKIEECGVLSTLTFFLSAQEDGSMEENGLDASILAYTPTFVAVGYQRLLEIQDPQEQVTQILHIYNLHVRGIATGKLTQYLRYNLDQARDPDLDKLLEQKLPHLAPGDVEEILFATMRAYKDHR